MAKRKLTVMGGFIAVCEEAWYTDEEYKNITSLFHPRLNKLTECAGYAPYWVCGGWVDYQKVEEYKA